MNKQYLLFIYREEASAFKLYGYGDFKYIQELLQDYVKYNHMYGRGIVDFRIEDFEYYLSKHGELECGEQKEKEMVINKCVGCKHYKPFKKSVACDDCDNTHFKVTGFPVDRRGGIRLVG